MASSPAGVRNSCVAPTISSAKASPPIVDASTNSSRRAGKSETNA